MKTLSILAFAVLVFFQSQPRKTITPKYEMWYDAVDNDGRRAVLIRPGNNAKKILDEICAKAPCTREYAGELWTVQILDRAGRDFDDISH